MSTLTRFDPEAAGFRVASPIRRRKRRPSSRTTPKPQYADAVLYSFQQAQPLEVSVRTTAVEDTVRRLKRAARYQERTTGSEIRVQISVEAYSEEDIAADPKLKNKSRVKFLGHEPWLLGRRVGKERAAELGVVEPEAPAGPSKHRRTVAATRPRHARSALQLSLVRAVITAEEPRSHAGRGSSFFLVRCRCAAGSEAVDFHHHHARQHGGFSTGTGGCRMTEYYREYVEVSDPDDGGPPFVAEVRLCHDFPEIAPNGGNQVVVFDDRVPMSVAWGCADQPTDTDTWGVLVP